VTLRVCVNFLSSGLLAAKNAVRPNTKSDQLTLHADEDAASSNGAWRRQVNKRRANYTNKWMSDGERSTDHTSQQTHWPSRGEWSWRTVSPLHAWWWLLDWNSAVSRAPLMPCNVNHAHIMWPECKKVQNFDVVVISFWPSFAYCTILA